MGTIITIKEPANGLVAGMWYKVVRVLKGEGLIQIQGFDSKSAVIDVMDIDRIDTDYKKP